MRTTLYLVRHAATEANLAIPARLQGRSHNPPLARIGLAQAIATRDFLADCRFDGVFSSPLLRAVQTAGILAQPHGQSPVPVDGLIECDVGRWEGLDWSQIRQLEHAEYMAYMSDPENNGYPGGENFAQAHSRSAAAIEQIWNLMAGRTVLVVSHHVICRTYLARALGMSLRQARQISLDNCGVSVLVRENEKTVVRTFNATFHLRRLESQVA